jgi:hypothetical protein
MKKENLLIKLCCFDSFVLKSHVVLIALFLLLQEWDEMPKTLIQM